MLIKDDTDPEMLKQESMGSKQNNNYPDVKNVD